MAAYVISDLEIRDRALVERYRSLAQASIAKFGGRYLARGGVVEPVEGGWTPKNIVIVEFPTMEKAREWYRSPEYAPLITLRQKASRGRLVLSEGT